MRRSRGSRFKVQGSRFKVSGSQPSVVELGASPLNFELWRSRVELGLRPVEVKCIYMLIMLIFYFFVPRHGGERGGGWVSYLCSRNQIKTGSRFSDLKVQSDPRVDDKFQVHMKSCPEPRVKSLYVSFKN